MFGFQLSKWFWNLWDHLLGIILWNLLFILVLGGLLYLLDLGQTEKNWPVFFFSAFVGLFVLTVLQHGIALLCYSIAKSDRSNWKESFCGALQKKSLLAAALLQICLYVLLTVVIVSWRFYTQQNNLVSIMALALLFWVSLFIILCAGFYFPMLVREEFHFLNTLRKIPVICLDNILLAFVLALISLVLFGLSLIPPVMLFFGAVGLNLWYEVSMRILYYKYQYLKELQEDGGLEDNGDNTRPAWYRVKKYDIPWRVLLREERERIGPRSLRNFIFPWKD